MRGENANGPDDITFIKGLEKTGPVSENNIKYNKEHGIHTHTLLTLFFSFQVRNGKAEITLKIADLQEKVARLTLEDMALSGVRFYIAATVTDTLSKHIW